MAAIKRNRFLANLIGAERGGKSFWAKNLAKQYTKQGSVLVYNIGKVTDWPDSEGFEMIEPLGFEDTLDLIYTSKELAKKYKARRKVEFFKYKGKIYHFSDFNKMFFGKKLKCHQMDSLEEERSFFTALYKHVSFCLFICDDCLPIFQYGLKSEHSRLLFKKNHTGEFTSYKATQSGGIDVLLIWHNIDHVTSKIWDATNHAVLFRFSMTPVFDKFQNPQLAEVCLRVHEYLLKAPQYTAIQVSWKGEEMGELSDVTI